ncbi:hypothetical protein [Candidatus Magnetaquicoccus inordinatus]|uniref:hypothetical protein n=1 Tax=Candidatus Magnetaquicoccus inordinatus TaxID=2496818 RepID=UPI00102D043F|nr:hypothetical protein [Candidatus Magnetaquicoccus inordinatus]
MFEFIKKFSEKREKPRVSLERTIRFVSKSGISCSGTAKNISEKSLLLISEHRNPVSENEEGEIIVDYKGVTSIFPGRVMRAGKYSIDKYCIAIAFCNQETIHFFAPMIVNSSTCLNCGSSVDLEKCPSCKGLQTICALCLARDGMCRECRSEGYLQKMRDSN